MFLDPAELIMQPSHLCASCCFNTGNLTPLCSHVRRIAVEFSKIKSKKNRCVQLQPTVLQFATRSSSNKAIVSAAVLAKRRISSLKCRCSKNGIPSSMSKRQNQLSLFLHSVPKLTCAYIHAPFQHTAKQSWAQHTSLSHSGVDGLRIAVAMFTLHFSQLTRINQQQNLHEIFQNDMIT